MKWLVGSPELGLESQPAVQLGPVPLKPLQEKAGDRSMREGYFLHLKFSADQREQLGRRKEQWENVAVCICVCLSVCVVVVVFCVCKFARICEGSREIQLVVPIF